MSGKRLFLLFAVVLLSGIGVLGYTAFSFLWHAYPRVMLPVLRFDDGERKVLNVESPETEYLVALEVDSLDDSIPTHEMTITTAEGKEVSLLRSRATGRSQLMGHQYRHLYFFTPGDTSSVEMLMTVTEPDQDGGRADLAVFYSPLKEYRAQLARVLPLELVGAGFLLVSFILLLVLLRRRRSKVLEGLAGS